MYRKCVIAYTFFFCLTFSLQASESGSTLNHDEALGVLCQGNARYVNGQPQTWSANTEKRELLAKGQHPIAAIITCSDSRVSPEILFDQSLGDVFVVRLAGNVVTPEAVGSVEYAVAHLHVPLVVVLGHSSCGAVGAAIAEPDAEGPIGTLVSLIKPSIEIAKQKGFEGDELAAAVVNENARRGAEILMQSSRVIEEMVKCGQVAVLSATYDLKSGLVGWQTQLSSPSLDVNNTQSQPEKSLKKETTAERIPISTSTVGKSTKHSTKH